MRELAPSAMLSRPHGLDFAARFYNYRLLMKRFAPCIRGRPGAVAALAAFLLTGVIAPVTVLAADAAAAKPTLEELIKPPQTLSVTLSRTGSHLAVLTPYRNRINIAVIDMATRKGTLITNFEDFDVISANWVGDDRLVFSLGQLNE